MSARSLKDTIYERLSADIRTGVFKPGERLIEAELSKRYGASRGPVREVLNRLATDGVITMNTNRGATVIEMTTEQIVESLIVRALLEGTAARYAATYEGSFVANMLAAVLERMRLADQNDNDVIFWDLHWQFHETLCHSSENELLIKFWNTTKAVLHLATKTNISTGISREHVLETTTHFLDLIRGGNPDLAESGIKDQILTTGFNALGMNVPKAFQSALRKDMALK